PLPVLGGRAAQPHREAAGVSSGDQLLRVSPVAVLEPRREGVVTTPDSVADRHGAGAVHQVSVPLCTSVASRHRLPPCPSPRFHRSEATASALGLVLVVAVKPELDRATLIAPNRGAIEQEVVAHGRLEAARSAHVAAVDDAVLERVCAQARRLGAVTARRRSGSLRHLLDDWGNITLEEWLELLLVAGEADVAVEVAACRRGPIDVPAHPLLVGLELLEGRSRDEHQLGVVALQ